MSDRQPPPEREQPRLPRKVALAYLEAFHRIVKIGTYYPEGHVALDRAAHLFQHSLQSVAEARKSAVVDIRGRSFTLEDQEIPATTPALTELATLFDDLGIGRVEIDRAVPLKDVLQLVRTLLLQRAQLQGAKEFTKVRIADLPQSIRIVSREFLIDEAAIVVERGSDDGQNLDTVFQALEKQGLNRRQIAQCRKLLDLLAQRVTAQPIRAKGLPAVGLHRKQQLEVLTVRPGMLPRGPTVLHAPGGVHDRPPDDVQDVGELGGFLDGFQSPSAGADSG